MTEKRLELKYKLVFFYARSVYRVNRSMVGPREPFGTRREQCGARQNILIQSGCSGSVLGQQLMHIPRDSGAHIMAYFQASKQTNAVLVLRAGLPSGRARRKKSGAL